MTQQTPWWCRVFGHKMKPRYSVEPVSVVLSEPNYGFGRSEMQWREVRERRTYQGDVCQRCALTSNRKTAQADPASEGHSGGPVEPVLGRGGGPVEPVFGRGGAGAA